jgi:hypothetical protein
MSKYLSARATTTALGIILLGVACHAATAPDAVIRADGTIQRSVGGCYRILTSTHAYQPLSLPATFQVEGLPVHFEARLKPTFNTCMAGDVVELLSIAQRS